MSIPEESRADGKKRIRKSSVEWSMKSSIALIHQVEQFENIWDSKSTSYKNRDMNNNSWHTISQTLSIPKHEIILRWNALRGNYQTHLKKNNETKSGQAANKFKRVNPLFAEMKFLDPVMKNDSRLRESNTAQTPTPTETASSIQITVDSENNESLPTSTPKRPRISQQNQPNSLERTATRNMMTSAYDLLMKNVQNDDEWDALGNMIASNARTWSREDLGFARRYKAALSAVNAQFELEAAKSTICVERESKQ